MSDRSWEPLAVAICGLLLALASYVMKDEILSRLVYGSGLTSAGLSLLHWFMAQRRRA